MAWSRHELVGPASTGSGGVIAGSGLSAVGSGPVVVPSLPVAGPVVPASAEVPDFLFVVFVVFVEDVAEEPSLLLPLPQPVKPRVVKSTSA